MANEDNPLLRKAASMVGGQSPEERVRDRNRHLFQTGAKIRWNVGVGGGLHLSATECSGGPRNSAGRPITGPLNLSEACAGYRKFGETFLKMGVTLGEFTNDQCDRIRREVGADYREREAA